MAQEKSIEGRRVSAWPVAERSEGMDNQMWRDGIAELAAQIAVGVPRPHNTGGRWMFAKDRDN
jgi:hypothetical protein